MNAQPREPLVDGAWCVCPCGQKGGQGVAQRNSRARLDRGSEKPGGCCPLVPSAVLLLWVKDPWNFKISLAVTLQLTSSPDPFVCLTYSPLLLSHKVTFLPPPQGPILIFRTSRQSSHPVLATSQHCLPVSP